MYFRTAQLNQTICLFLYIKTRKKGLISIIWQFLMLRQGLHRGRGCPPPPLFEKNKIKLSTVEPRYNEGPRDWQNMFVIVRFVNLYQGSFSYCLIFYYCWSKKQNSSLDRGLSYTFQCNVHFHKNSIFVGIKIFQHLNLLLICFDPISLKYLSLQNCTQSQTSAFSNQQGYVAIIATMWNGLFFMKVLE